ncbi:hypothetical protein [Pseudoalteromonas sp. MTN2-4]|uniref:hypothetical protein n=1 Tax=Pseudoalteromonas sp. MTN2-4 TaxID=3056555 RepID=UPI0036F1BACF
MKSILYIFILSISLSAFANPLKGTWEYVSGEYATPDGNVKAEAPAVTSTRIVSDTHFSYITRHSDKFAYAGGGTYVIKDNYFIETVEYGNLEDYIGRTMAFTFKIEGDLWYHTLYENGKFVESEIWKRVTSKL